MSSGNGAGGGRNTRGNASAHHKSALRALLRAATADAREFLADRERAEFGSEFAPRATRTDAAPAALPPQTAFVATFLGLTPPPLSSSYSYSSSSGPFSVHDDASAACASLECTVVRATEGLPVSTRARVRLLVRSASVPLEADHALLTRMRRVGHVDVGSLEVGDSIRVAPPWLFMGVVLGARDTDENPVPVVICSGLVTRASTTSLMPSASSSSSSSSSPRA